MCTDCHSILRQENIPFSLELEEYIELTKDEYTDRYVRLLREVFKAYEEVNKKRSKSLDFELWQIDLICGNYYNGQPSDNLKILRQRTYVAKDMCIFCDKKHSSNEHFNITVLIGDIVKLAGPKKKSFYKKFIPW